MADTRLQIPDDRILRYQASGYDQASVIKKPSNMKRKLLLSALLVSAALISQGQWSFDNLVQATCQLGSASVGTRAYFAGGFNGIGVMPNVEIYDVSTDSWDSTITMLHPRSFPTCVGNGTKVFFAGGMNLSSCLNYVDIWDESAKTWSQTALSVPRIGMGSASLGNRVLFAGGTNNYTGISYNVVDIYDVTTQSWTTAALSAPRGFMGFVTSGDLAFFAGGLNDQTSQVSDVIDIYRFSTDSWTTATLSEARCMLAAAAVGSKIIFAGGTRANNTSSDRIDIYDTLSGIWTTATLFNPRAFWQQYEATVNGKAYFAGGGRFNIPTRAWTSCASTINIYNGADSSWTIDNLSEAIINHAVTGLADHFVVAGGVLSNDQITSTVEIFHDPLAGISSQPGPENSLKVYPNPSSGEIHLDIPGQIMQKPLLASVYTIHGQLVFTKTLEPGNMEFNLELPAGVYLLKVVSDDISRFTTIAIQK
jgi:hypothetical protein